MSCRIAVVHNAEERLAAGASSESEAVASVRGMAEAIARACASLGHDPLVLAAPDDPAELTAALRTARPGLVFNLVESLRGDARLEAAAAWLFELLGLPYTGSGPVAMSLGLDKALAKDLMRARGVPVPRGTVLERGDEPLEPARGPWIVKPLREDASHGITSASVVDEEAAARRLARSLIGTYRQPALVEEFVDGRELNATLLAEGGVPRLLPLSEIDYRKFPAGLARIVSYDAKWRPDSLEWKLMPVIPFEAEPALCERVEAVALAAWRAIGLRDYGRVDLRIDRERGPLVLEVNPNPDLSPDAGFANAARRGGRSYEAIVGSIVDSALARAAE